jgi:hypothetical protein
MKRCSVLLFSLMMFAAAAIVRPAFARAQTSASAAVPAASSTPKAAPKAPVASSTAAKRSTARGRSKRRARPTKFVPKQKVPTPDRITEIQSALARGGFYQNDPNGKWDSTSVLAMQKFQSANGIEASGKLDAPSLQKLGLGSDIAGVSAPKPPVPAGSQPAGAAPEPPRGANSPSIAAPAAPSTAASISNPSALSAKSAQP